MLLLAGHSSICNDAERTMGPASAERKRRLESQLAFSYHFSTE